MEIVQAVAKGASEAVQLPAEDNIELPCTRVIAGRLVDAPLIVSE